MHKVITIGSLHEFCPNELEGRFGYEKLWHNPSGISNFDKNVVYANFPSDQLIGMIKNSYPDYFPLSVPIARGILDVDNKLWAIVDFTGGAHYFSL